MESANKYEVQQATDRLSAINEDKVLKVEELRAANALNLEGMKDFVKNNRKEPPKAPEAGASHEAMTQYQVDLGAYNELKGVLDRFDGQISALKTNYESSKDNLKEATKDELAKLESTLGIAKPEPAKAEAGTTAPGVTPAAADAPAAKPEPAKAETVTATPPSAPTEKKEDSKTAEYVVVKGDNLTKIAKAHGTTVDAIVKENGITDANKIRVGQKLKMPAKPEASQVEDGAAAKAAEKPATKDAKAGEGVKPEAGKGDKPQSAQSKPEASTDKPATSGEKPVAKPGEAQPATAEGKPKTESKPAPEATKVAYADIQARTVSGTSGNPFGKK